MARAAKVEKALTPEEKLARALVPAEDQPYAVPGNWCWTYINCGFDVTSSKRVHKNDWLSEGVPFYRTRELVKLSETGYVENELYISENLYNDFKQSYGVPKIGDLLISGVGTIGIPYIVENNAPFYFKDGNVIWFQNKGTFIPKYVYYLYKSAFMYNQIHEMSAGTTVDTYTIVNALKTILPLPPFAEQQRIVDRIESLFAKLDEAREKAQAVVDGFEDRKAAILHKAFTGELTDQWRRKQNISREQWTIIKLKECGNWVGGGTPSMAHREYWENGDLLWVTSKDMKADIIEDTLLHVNMIGVDNSSANYIVSPSVLFVMRSGILRRTLPIAMIKKPFTVNQDIKAVSPKKGIILEYLFWACKNAERKMLSTCMKNGTTVESINAKALMDFTIEIAPENEQKEIINVLDTLIIKEQQARESAEAVLAQIDTMKKAILARAFRGELGTNDPADESAEELLKRLL